MKQSWLFVIVLSVTTLLADEVINNASVIDMKSAGLGDAVIVNKIKTSTCSFDVTVDQLKKLKDGGLSDDIISAMIQAGSGSTAEHQPPTKSASVGPISNDPMTMHEPGLWIYVKHGTEKKMVKLKGQDCGRSSGWNKKSRAVLFGAAAVVQINSPTFAFYVYEKPKSTESALVTTTVTETVADDYILTKMEVRDDKSERRLAVGKEDFFGGKKSGLEGKDVVQSAVEKVAERIYRITPAQPLPPGEYCFIASHQANRESLKSGVVDLFDFGMKK